MIVLGRLHYPDRWARITQAQGAKNARAAHCTAAARIRFGKPGARGQFAGDAPRGTRSVAEPRRPAVAERCALAPLHRWVWRNVDRRARKLIHFAETEAEGGRHLAHAAELTSDPLLRRLFLRHALDEERHAALFLGRGQKLRRGREEAGKASGFDADWLAPGERGLASESGLD